MRGPTDRRGLAASSLLVRLVAAALQWRQVLRGQAQVGRVALASMQVLAGGTATTHRPRGRQPAAFGLLAFDLDLARVVASMQE